LADDKADLCRAEEGTGVTKLAGSPTRPAERLDDLVDRASTFVAVCSNAEGLLDQAIRVSNNFS
jgi:hypothetical protein